MAQKPNRKGKPFKKRNPRNEDNRDVQTTSQTGTTNDISWYDKYPDLLSAAANVPFATVPGMKVTTAYVLDAREGSTPYSGLANEYEPGVLAISWCPYVGKATDNNDPVSVAAREIYAKIRSNFSGSLNADAPDLVIYLLCLDSIFSYIGGLKRLYRTLNTYSPMNKATPDMLLGAMGYDDPEIIASLQANKDKLFGQINQLIYMTDEFVCPAVFPLFNRHYWLNDNVFGDEPTAKAQMYVFQQFSYYKFSMQNTPDGISAGGLEMVQFPTVSAETVVDDLYQFGSDLIGALASSDTSYDINGYLLKAYSDVPRFTVEHLSADVRLDIVYDEIVLSQIENVVLAPKNFTNALVESTVSQDPKSNSLLTIHGYTMGGKPRDYWIKPLINLHVDQPNYQQVVEATRMMAIADDPVKNDDKWRIEVNCATEVPIYLTLFTWDPQTGAAISYPLSQVIDAYGTAKSWFAWLSQLSHFRYHPRVLLIGGDMNGYTMTMWEEWNLSSISTEQFKRINEVCVYSLYNSFNVR